MAASLSLSLSLTHSGIHLPPASALLVGGAECVDVQAHARLVSRRLEVEVEALERLDLTLGGFQGREVRYAAVREEHAALWKKYSIVIISSLENKSPIT